MKRKMPIPYIYCILGGLLLGLILSLRQLYLYFFVWKTAPDSSWWEVGATGMVNQSLWGFLVPLVFWAYVRFGIRRAMSVGDKLGVLGASVAIASFHEAVSYIIWLVPLHLFDIEPFTWESLTFVGKAFPAGFILQWIEFWIIYGLFAAFDYARKYKNKQVELAQIEGQLTNAQLNALKNQLQPHFLFNTLNTISSLMEFDTKGAQKMVSKLGNLLRTVLDKKANNFVPLREELEFTKTYLDIEQTRFHDRLTIEFQIEQAILDVPVPNLILQPLVENAIKHGFATQSGKCRILVAAKLLENKGVQLIVSDNGKGTNLALETLLQKGIGLKNTFNRLQLIYAEQADFQVIAKAGEGFRVEMVLPQKG